MIVLLVEDDDDLRKVLELALGSEFDVRSCATGVVALETLRTERIDVLLTDLDLPGVSGEALAQAAKMLPRPVPVVAMSGDFGRLEACRRMVDAVIAKPSPLAAVRAALRRASRWGQVSGSGGLTANAALGMAVLASIACSRR
jgi:DNA-binding response OmpR family regulator